MIKLLIVAIECDEISYNRTQEFICDNLRIEIGSNHFQILSVMDNVTLDSITGSEVILRKDEISTKSN